MKSNLKLNLIENRMVVQRYVFNYREDITSLFKHLQYQRRDDIDTRSLMSVRHRYREDPKNMCDLKRKIWDVYYGSDPNIFQCCPMCKQKSYNKMDIHQYQLNYIIPHSLGGLESQENLILLCTECTENMSEMETIFDYEQKVHNRNNCEALWINQNIISINRPLIYVDTTCIPIKGPMDTYLKQSRQQMRQDYDAWYKKKQERKRLVHDGYIPCDQDDPFNEIFDEICVKLENFHITTPPNSPSPTPESYPYNPFNMNQLAESLSVSASTPVYENNPYNQQFAYSF